MVNIQMKIICSRVTSVRGTAKEKMNLGWKLPFALKYVYIYVYNVNEINTFLLVKINCNLKIIVDIDVSYLKTNLYFKLKFFLYPYVLPYLNTILKILIRLCIVIRVTQTFFFKLCCKINKFLT